MTLEEALKMRKNPKSTLFAISQIFLSKHFSHSVFAVSKSLFDYQIIYLYNYYYIIKGLVINY